MESVALGWASLKPKKRCVARDNVKDAQTDAYKRVKLAAIRKQIKTRGEGTRRNLKLKSCVLQTCTPQFRFIMEETGFHPDLIHAIFKLEWSRRSLEREKNENNPDAMDCETSGVDLQRTYLRQVDAGAGTSKKSRPMSANANALKLSSKLVQIFISEAVQRAATIAEAEGISRIEPTHLERVLPQLLLDF
ncbi:protein MHF2 homolog isoform X1 [Cucumis sativus]|uniref:protein MHF2 homolog isoform X1 n=1 Tax=Cucumis sativus TaxID=3659 RepID=UPI0012F4DF42|nr:protein MHF2 homolog isoform X1 [Cucumis sativus]